MSLSPASGPDNDEPYALQSNRAKHVLRILCKCGCTDKTATFGKHGGMAVLTTTQNIRKMVRCNPGYSTTVTDCCTAVKYFPAKRARCTGILRASITSKLAIEYATREQMYIVAKRTSHKRVKGWWMVMHMNAKTKQVSCPACGSSHSEKQAANQSWVRVAASGDIVKLPSVKEQKLSSKLASFLSESKVRARRGLKPRFEQLYSLDPNVLRAKLTSLKPPTSPVGGGGPP